MYVVDSSEPGQMVDVARFVALLNGLGHHPLRAARSLFDLGREVIVARAPGRLDVMGGIADYSGSLVLQLPIAEATLVALQRHQERTLQIISLGDDRPDDAAVFSMPLVDFESQGRPIDYAAAKAYFKRKPQQAWAAYAAGALLVLMREKGVTFPEGMRLLIHSSVPEGKGVSSSAAIEVAAMSAVAAAFGLDLEARELALLCQRVENQVVGAPCGVMDQMSSACGQANRLLALLCQPAEIQGHVAIPPELAVWGIDSGLRHAVSGADYSSVRVGTFMGYKILRSAAGKNWGGYLANVTPSEFEQHYRVNLPKTMRGADFLGQYGETDDPVTTVKPAQTYAVRRPAGHPIYEHFRVQTFAGLLTGDARANALHLGELMYQSHASYSACGLGSEGTDLLVSLVRQAGQAQGLFGAKITGGGSGGTVAVLGHVDAAAAVQAVAQRYGEQCGQAPYIFTGSSPGAAAFASLTLKPVVL